MTDRAIIDKVTSRVPEWYKPIMEQTWKIVTNYRIKVLVRYTRWIERAKCEVVLDALNKRWEESEHFLEREAGYEIRGLKEEVNDLRSQQRGY